jgi:hypothetical protein
VWEVFFESNKLDAVEGLFLNIPSVNASLGVPLWSCPPPASRGTCPSLGPRFLALGQKIGKLKKLKTKTTLEHGAEFHKKMFPYQ